MLLLFRRGLLDDTAFQDACRKVMEEPTPFFQQFTSRPGIPRTPTPAILSERLSATPLAGSPTQAGQCPGSPALSEAQESLAAKSRASQDSKPPGISKASSRSSRRLSDLSAMSATPDRVHFVKDGEQGMGGADIGSEGSERHLPTEAEPQESETGTETEARIDEEEVS